MILLKSCYFKPIFFSYYIICLSETFLNSSIESNDDRISIDGCNLIRLDYSSDSTRGGVCLYYKDHIPLIKRDSICTLDNCIVTEIRSKGEKYCLTCIYRSPTQSHDEFESFWVNFDLLLNNIHDKFPICSIVTGDVNAHCSSLWKNDITNTPGQEIDSLTSSAGCAQIAYKPTHVVFNSMSCINLIFCTNKNINSNYRVDVPIFEKCHHNIIYGKTNIWVPLPPVYIREVWDCSKANIENINNAISSFNWTRAFEIFLWKKTLLKETLLNIYRNYIPYKKIKCDYRQPPWMTGNIFAKRSKKN